MLRRLQKRGVPAGVRLIGASDPRHVAALGNRNGPGDAWVVVDAVRLGEKPGTLHQFSDVCLPGTVRGITHRALPPAWLCEDGRPEQVVVLGVEPADLSYGLGLSPVVRHRIALLELVVRAAIVFLLRSGGA